jgi:uncharacterized membrane protein YsdA (DUF1294 family)
MQLGMVAVAVGGIVTVNHTWVPAALVSLLVSAVPTILRRDLRVVLPAELNFWIVLALFLHVVGGYSGFYDTLPGWDHLTHAMSASLVAAIGFVVVVALDKYVESIFLPPLFLAFFIVMFTMSVGVVWELMEYAIDQLTGSMLQYSLNDSMIDLLFDLFGGFMVAIVGTYYLRHTTQEHFVESLQLDEAKGRIGRVVRKRRWPYK